MNKCCLKIFIIIFYINSEKTNKIKNKIQYREAVANEQYQE